MTTFDSRDGVRIEYADREQFTVQPFLVAVQNRNRKAWELYEAWGGSMSVSARDMAGFFLDRAGSNIHRATDYPHIAVWKLAPGHMGTGTDFHYIEGEGRPTRSYYGEVFDIEVAPRLKP
jgi:hypothetical protein